MMMSPKHHISPALRSKHPAAELHAAARVVSGGPLYVSDYPGAHDFDLLRRLVLPDGSILRALLPGRPTRDSLFADVLRDSRSLLKVGPVFCWEVTYPTAQSRDHIKECRCRRSSWDDMLLGRRNEVMAMLVMYADKAPAGVPCAHP